VVKERTHFHVCAAGAIALLLSGSAFARNDKLLLPLQPASRAAQQFVGQDVQLRFGKASAAGAEIMSVVEGQASVDPWENSSYAGSGGRSRRSDEDACADAFRKAALQLRQRAKGVGAGAVVGIVSNYNGEPMDSTELYECHAGMTRAVVQLKGQAARALPAEAAPVAAPVAAPAPAARQVGLIASGYANIGDIDAVPYLSDKGREDYRAYLTQPTPKAFALSPTGQWASASTLVAADKSLPTDPTERAVVVCNRTSPTPCRLYAVNGSVVWTREASTAR
jgi:uncharacterized protein YbjQ (UPF0145 family)